MSLYAYKYGVQHLCEEYQSRGTDEKKKIATAIEDLLLNFDWMLDKLYALKVEGTTDYAMAIVYDVERYLRSMTATRPLKTIRILMRTMRLMAPSLREDANHLPSQSVGRMVNLDEDYEDYRPSVSGIATQLVTQAQECRRFNWWCPKMRTLE